MTALSLYHTALDTHTHTHTHTLTHTATHAQTDSAMVKRIDRVRIPSSLFLPRLFPVFHAYMAGIVQVLDENQEWGMELLNLTLQLLLFCAAPRPQKRTDVPEFSLIRLPQHIRHKWLLASLIILYKVMLILSRIFTFTK